MKRLALVLCLVMMLCACAETPPPATTAPPQTTVPTETTMPPETTQPSETTEPVQTTAPTEALREFEEYYVLLEYTWPEINWIHNAMGCIFEEPTQIDLEYLFYAGFRNGSWELLSPDSQQYLIDQGFMRQFDIQPMPAAELNRVLETYFAVSLSEMTISDGWEFAEREGFYCSNHNDAYDVGGFTITNVTEHEDGRVEIFYHAPGYYYDTQNDEFLEDVDLILTLQRQEDGTYLVRSNLLQS